MQLSGEYLEVPFQILVTLLYLFVWFIMRCLTWFSLQYPQSIAHCFTDTFPLWCDTAGACGYSTKEWVSRVSFNKPTVCFRD